jgi:CO/xanthine dehydrogenase Mo-binding subunit
MVEFGIGQPVPRKEDMRFLTGRGRYLPDIALPNMAFAALVRSAHAHAQIKSIDKRIAEALTGVIAVFTGEDALTDGLKPIDHKATLTGGVVVTGRTGFTTFAAAQPLLPVDKVRHVGEPVAIVVAESLDSARHGAELVEIGYEILPAVTMAIDAIKPGAPQVRNDGRSNLCVDFDVGDKAATDAAFARTVHTVRFETWIQRVTGTPMEPRNAIGDYDPAAGRYTLYAGAGLGVVKYRQDLATYSVLPRNGATCCAATWVGISAHAISSSPNTRCCPGPRDGSAGRSSGSATEPNLSSATIKAAISRSRPNSRWTPTAISSRCAAPISAISAHIPCRSCRCARGSASCPECTVSRRFISAVAPR